MKRFFPRPWLAGLLCALALPVWAAFTDNGNGTTTVEYRLAVDVKIPMIGMLKRKAEKVIVETALKGLKKRVESGATSAP